MEIDRLRKKKKKKKEERTQDHLNGSFEYFYNNLGKNDTKVMKNIKTNKREIVLTNIN
jgi:hypothetical protein